MTAAIARLLGEAYRRLDMADSHERSKPLIDRWVGLGTETIYRPVLEAGLMHWHDGQTPPKRCMGWLCLTQDGITLMWDRRHKLKGGLKLLKSNTGYNSSLVANYQLAGGLSKR